MRRSLNEERVENARQRILSFTATKKEHAVRISAYTQFGVIASSAFANDISFTEAATSFDLDAR